MDSKDENIVVCGCGRSPTGECIGWHEFTEEEYQKQLKKYQDKEKKIKDWYLYITQEAFHLNHLFLQYF